MALLVETAQASLQKTPETPAGRPVLRWIAIFVVVAAVATGVYMWLQHEGHYESTDDAQIEGHIDVISARVTGTVVNINPKVVNNEYVEAGTLLVELDPNDYQVTLDHARADQATRQSIAQSARVNIPIVRARAFSQLAAARAARDEAAATIDTEQAKLSVAEFEVQRDEALAARAERDRVRYLALVEKKEISRSDYDQRETDATAATHTLEADRAAVTAARNALVEARARVAQKQAEIDGAETAPDQVTDAQAQSQTAAGQLSQVNVDIRNAQLNLSYAKIYAPVSGIVGRKTVETGQRIQPGQALLAIVPLDDIWITANFKETQLKLMRKGQPVSVHVDENGRDFAGYVENLPGAAGTLFSLLPPENASGNFVKVVQRLPVRIRLKAGQDAKDLRPGMSVTPTVTVR
jgi:membrane fusion protein (multidrug efflux system)